MHVLRNIVRGVAVATIIVVSVPGAALAESAESNVHGGGNGGAVSSDLYIELDALNVTLYRNNAPAGVLTARLVLQLHSGEARIAVSTGRAKLRNALLQELYFMAEREAHSGSRIDLDLVKVRMRRAARRALGPNVVEDVLVQALLRRGA
jgi:hypothetical protein